MYSDTCGQRGGTVEALNPCAQARVGRGVMQLCLHAAKETECLWCLFAPRTVKDQYLFLYHRFYLNKACLAIL